MVVIPPPKDTDAEDVAWGLQTAETLWKRGERIDAIIWLRRAAQAAGDAADDDRALELARSAAELSDWMATQPSFASQPPSAQTSQPPPPTPVVPAPGSYDPHNASTFVPFIDAHSAITSAPSAAGPSTFVPDGGPVSIEVDLEDAEVARGELPAFAPPVQTASVRPAPPLSRPPSQPTIQTAEPYFPPPAVHAQAPPPPPPPEDGEPSAKPSVPPAEQVHAGMFNPWDERKSPTPQEPGPPAASGSGVPERFREDEEVITSVRPQQLAKQRADSLAAALRQSHPQSGPPPPSFERESEHESVPPPPPLPDVSAKPAAPRPSPGRPPPLPPRARKPASIPQAPVTPTEGMAPLPPSARPTPPIPSGSVSDSVSRMTPAPPSPTQVMEVPQRRPRRVDAEAEAEANAKAQAEADARAEAEAEAHAKAEADARAQAQADADARAEEEANATAREEARMQADADARAEAEARAEEAAAHVPAPEPTEPGPVGAATPIAVPAQLDLEDVEAFADLPDDARAAFAAAAQVSTLGEGEEVSVFALAYILSGTVDVAATMVDAPALRLSGGAVLRSKGTMEEGVPMRLIGVGAGVVATWTDAAVADAFRTCPWVEEDLRTAADRVQTLVGVTIGPLGERLDASIRDVIISKLTMRTLIAGELVATMGELVPGLLLIGVGELELVDGESVTGVVGSGEFLFPGEVLGMGNAPRTARAGPGGALILFGDRLVAQELLVTCPPLLEVFAGM